MLGETMMLITGSVALAANGVNLREPKDFDRIATIDDFLIWCSEHKDQIEAATPISAKTYVVLWKDGAINEFEIAHPGSSGMDLIEHLEDYYDQPEVILSLDWLYTLKASHRYLKDSPHFEKTFNDYKYLQAMGCQIQDFQVPKYPNITESWFKKRERETYTARRPSLNRNKKDFFDPNIGVQYKYDHDSIHEAVAKYGFQDRPAYTYYGTDDHEVLSSKQKFFSLGEALRLRGVIEEALVLALERSQIPHGDTITPRESYKIALQKVCTSITSGWFREYAYENYQKALNWFTVKTPYVEWLQQGIKDGVVKKFQT